ncbi:MAG: hypothetical protein NC117_00180 [Pseudoflavonifractor sp.]|nr:hypothetical protein [Pseudoflavonifractor sp.]
MKKYFAILAAVFAVILSSCSNDDIPVSQTTTFKINPNTVISGFQEWNAGDLTVINSSYQLRIRLLVYNESGSLVQEDEQFFTDYAHLMTSNLNLAMGERYKAIAITDITRKSDGFEYWELSGKENLSTLKLSDTGYLGSQKNILGIASTDIISGDGTQVDMNVQPAGSLIIVYYEGIRSWSNVTDYQLGINRSADYVTFDNLAQPEWNVQASSTYDWRISHIEVSDWDDSPNVENIYDYVFTLPYGNTNVEFEYKTSNGWYSLTRSASINLGIGSEYLVRCDIAEKTIDCGALVSGRSAMSFGDMLMKSASMDYCPVAKYDDMKLK